jgi:hypothetical protein
MVAVVGCSTKIPPKLQVRDVSTGKSYETYQPWGKVVKGAGYQFTDAETGKKITLTNYEVSTIEGEKKVPDKSAEAKEFKEAMERGGIKD